MSGSKSYVSPEVADERSCSWARLAAPHKRPLLVYHYSRVRYGEFQELASLRFGQLLGEPVKFLYAAGFASRRNLGRGVLVHNEVSRETDHHAEHDVERRVDHAYGGGVRFANRQGYQAMYQQESRDRDYRGQQNDRKPKESRGCYKPRSSSVASTVVADPRYIPRYS